MAHNECFDVALFGLWELGWRKVGEAPSLYTQELLPPKAGVHSAACHLPHEAVKVVVACGASTFKSTSEHTSLQSHSTGTFNNEDLIPKLTYSIGIQLHFHGCLAMRIVHQPRCESLVPKAARSSHELWLSFHRPLNDVSYSLCCHQSLAIYLDSTDTPK